MQVAAFLPAAPSAPAGVAPSSASFSSATGTDAAVEEGTAFAGGFESLLDSQTGSPQQDAPELASPRSPAPPACEAPVVEPSHEAITLTASALLLQMPVPAAAPAPTPPPAAEPAAPDAEAVEPTMVECTEADTSSPLGNAAANSATPLPPRGHPVGVASGQIPAPAMPTESSPLGPTRGRPTYRPVPADNTGTTAQAPAPATSGTGEACAAEATTPETESAPAAPIVRGGVRQVCDQTPVAPENEPAEPAGAAASHGPNENANTAATTAPTRGRPRGLGLGLANGTANPRADTRSAVTRGTPIPLEEATELISEDAATAPIDETAAPLVSPSPAAPTQPLAPETVTRGRSTTATREANVTAVPAEPNLPKETGRGRPVTNVEEVVVPAGTDGMVLRAPGRGVPTATVAAPLSAMPVVRALVAEAVEISDETAEIEAPAPEAAEPTAPPTASAESTAVGDEVPLLRVTGFHVERSRIRVTERAPAENAVRQLAAWPAERTSMTSSSVAASPAAPAEIPAPATAAALLSAAPTLVQLSVDAAVVNRTVPVPKPSEAVESAVASTTTVAFDEEEYPVETITIVLPAASEEASGEAGKSRYSRPAPEAKAERANGPAGQPMPLRENPAAGRGKNPATPVVAGVVGESQNFLSVDKQEVVRTPREVGTRMAEGRPTMVASTLLPAATEASTHETGSLLPVGTGRPTLERSSGASTPEAPQLRSYAAAAVREVMAAAEKLVPPRTTIELRLQAFDQENVRVQLVWRDGTIHARFVTETPELQQALNREWDGAMPRFAEKGLKFSEASFEHRDSAGQGGSSHGAFSSEQHGRGRRSFTEQEFPEFAVPAFLSAVTGRAASVPVDLPSMATAMQPLAVAPRGLRVWA